MNKTVYFELSDIISIIQIREILEAKYTQKVSRIYISNQKLDRLLPLLKKLNLYFELSEFTVIEHKDEKKGEWHNMAERGRKDNCNGLRYIYISHNKELARQAKEYEFVENADEFGKLLNIPECCRSFFIKYKKEAIEKYDDDYAIITARNTKSMGPFNSLINYLSQYFGSSLISHYPCSFSCEASIKKAKHSLTIIKDFNIDLFRRIQWTLEGLYIFENRKGVYYIPGRYEKDHTFIYNYKEIKWTNKTPLIEVLISSSSIKWCDFFSFYIDDHHINNKDTIIIPFKKF